MIETLGDRLLEAVTEWYLTSGDFNGLTVREAVLALEADESSIRSSASMLLERGLLDLHIAGHGHPNIHIKALDLPDRKHQLEHFPGADAGAVGLYPSPSHLEAVVNRRDYEGRPFTERLALGEPQLRHYAFDLSVLEVYRNDPRYYLSHNDVGGTLHARDASAETLAQRDRVFLQDLGFCYDDELNRAVAVYLHRLGQLTPEHQQIWNARLLPGKYRLHPDFYRPTMLGEFPEGISVFEAVLGEIALMNEMVKAIGRPVLFRQTFEGRDRPQQFGFLIRPTLQEFNDFVLVLDKMLSDNLNKKFFAPEVTAEIEEERADGKIVVRQKGTITMLSEWLAAMFTSEDQAAIEEMLDTLREVRHLRQKPAHGLHENEFDQGYFKQQRELMKRVYRAVLILRSIFANHPAARNLAVPDHLTKRVWMM